MWQLIKNLPEDKSTLCVFAEWYPHWQMFLSEYTGTVQDMLDHRQYDYKNTYTHYFILPSKP